MSKKILVVSMGQGGNKIATAFFENLLADCGVGPNGEPPANAALAKALTVFCDRTSDGRFIPRRLMGVIGEGQFPGEGSPYSHLYPAEAKVLESAGIGGVDGCHNYFLERPNWVHGYEESPTVQTLLELTVRRVEELGGEVIIWLFHSLAGSYGSGGGSKFLELAAEQLDGSAALVSIPILPSPRVSDVIVEPYNAILGLPNVFEYAHLVLVLHNGAMYRAFDRPNEVIQYKDINLGAGTALSALVSPMLWPDKAGRRLTADQFHSQLINPASGMNDADKWSREAASRSSGERLIMVSKWENAASPNESQAEIARRVVGPRQHLLSTETPKDWLSVLVVINGNHADSSDLDHAVGNGAVKLAINPRAKSTRAIAAGRNTGLIETLKDLSYQFEALYHRKTFLHWYEEKGLNEMDFFEASQALSNVISRLEDDVRQQAG